MWTRSSFSPFSRPLTAKTCSMSMLSARPTRSPFRKTSAKQSRPSNTSSASRPGISLAVNGRAYQTCERSQRVRDAMFIPKNGSGMMPLRCRSSSKLPGTVQGSSAQPAASRSETDVKRRNSGPSLYANDHSPVRLMTGSLLRNCTCCLRAWPATPATDRPYDAHSCQPIFRQPHPRSAPVPSISSTLAP